jgi:hypothetical protein
MQNIDRQTLSARQITMPNKNGVPHPQHPNDLGEEVLS